MTMKRHTMMSPPPGMGADPGAGGPPPVTVTVPLQALGLADGVQDGAGAPQGGPPGQQGPQAAPALPGQGDPVQMVIEGTVAAIDGGMATIAISAVNGAPIDTGSAGGPGADDDPAGEEAQMRAMAQQQDDSDGGGY